MVAWQPPRWPRWRVVLAVLAIGCVTALAAVAQSDLRLSDPERLTRRLPGGSTAGAVPSTPAKPAPSPPANPDHRFVLTDVQIEGTSTLPRGVMAATWQQLRGTTVTTQQIYDVADAIGVAYGKAGYALYTVTVPQQDFGSAPVRIRVVEGYVDAVSIEGNTDGADLSLLKAYIAPILAEHPLRQATLERQILLMNAISGVTLGSRFEPIEGKPGAVRLRLGLVRKSFDAGIGFSNQGATVLSELQLNVNAVANGLIREGDSTQFVFGFPTGLSRYQYYGVNHIEPLGSNGATLTLSLGDLVTHQQGTNIGGNAFIGSVQARYPVILSVHESLAVTAQFDYLNATNAFLGATLTDERTRPVRFGANYAVQDAWEGIDAAAFTFSEGLDFLGARRGGVAYGGPSFTKVNLRLGREQPLPLDFVLRGRFAGQYAFDHLPASEQFAFGGPDFGQAFQIGTLFGDQAVAAAVEVAYKLPDETLPHWLNHSELFVTADWARLWNRNTIYQFRQDGGTSGGFGARTRLMDKVALQMEVARVLVQPVSVPPSGPWRFFVSVTGSF